MTISELIVKHDKLKKLDGGSFFKKPQHKIFGSLSHKYKFNKCLTKNEVNNFENDHKIILPAEYKNFITQIGNGGSGPAYGLFELNSWNFELDINIAFFLNQNFPHTEKWNLEQKFDINEDDYFDTPAYQSWEQEYYSNIHITGSMRICHYGCAIYYMLVVTGNEKGNIWVDDRASDFGIYPAISKITGQKLQFIEWYNEWLNESLLQLQA
jgi:SMI1 / KNR4 family (SUKH-1)